MRRFWTMLLMAAGCFSTLAALELPGIFSDNMVLQRDREIRIWGKGEPGETIRVEFKGREGFAQADSDGKWFVTLAALPASAEGALLTVKGSSGGELTRSNVLVGDVWLCAGQSNMQWDLRSITGAEEFLKFSEHPQIRLFKIETDWSRTPREDVKSKWTLCTPEHARGFSAVGYLTGLKLQQALDVPVGLIRIAWGGARIEAMCAPESFREAGVNEHLTATFEKEIAQFEAQKDEELRKDKQRLPVAVFNAMVRSITPFAVRGILWYQGEDNHWEGMDYAEKLRAFAWSWRHYFENPDLPIYVVLIAPWQYGEEDPERIPRFWTAQRHFAEQDRNAGYVVTTDLGNPDDIHPRDKAPLGDRLAKLVLYKSYGIGGNDALSPYVEKAVWKYGKIDVEFRFANGLRSRDGKEISYLEVAGADGKFYPATGTVEGEHLIVSLPDEVKQPQRLRFGWHKTANPNLVNRAGVPVMPFNVEVAAAVD